jgi:hypothetical protein
MHQATAASMAPPRFPASRLGAEVRQMEAHSNYPSRHDYPPVFVHGALPHVNSDDAPMAALQEDISNFFFAATGGRSGQFRWRQLSKEEAKKYIATLNQNEGFGPVLLLLQRHLGPLSVYKSVGILRPELFAHVVCGTSVDGEVAGVLVGFVEDDSPS